MIIFFLSAFFSLSIKAASVESLITFDLNALIRRTVNEGDRIARVESIKSVVCKYSPKTDNPKVTVARCDVGFRVKIENCHGKTSYTSCYLIYGYENPAEIKRGPMDLVNRCMENLNGVVCGG